MTGTENSLELICVNLGSSVAEIMSTLSDAQRMEKNRELMQAARLHFSSSEIYGG